MSQSIKNFLVVVNTYESPRPDANPGGRPRIKSALFVLKSVGIPAMKNLKALFNNAAVDAVLSTPKELRAARTDPGYRVTWSDAAKLPADSLRRHGLSLYDHADGTGFSDVTVLNANAKDPFDLSEITGTRTDGGKTA